MSETKAFTKEEAEALLELLWMAYDCKKHCYDNREDEKSAMTKIFEAYPELITDTAAHRMIFREYVLC